MLKGAYLKWARLSPAVLLHLLRDCSKVRTCTVVDQEKTEKTEKEIKAPFFLFSAVTSPLPAVIARGEARFPAEELREMAGIGVAHVQGNLHHAFPRLAEQPSRRIHPQMDMIRHRRAKFDEVAGIVAEISGGGAALRGGAERRDGGGNQPATDAVHV